MKPARFAYHAPASLEAALDLLAELRDQDAKVLAGGQSLMPLLNMRLVRPRHLVDLNGLAELSYIRPTSNGGLALGALTRQRTLERAPEVAGHAPLLAAALPLIGDRQVRFRGTIGGSLAHADPAAELPAVAVALDAELVVGRRGQRRMVPAADFFLSFLTPALEPDEVLLEVRLPPTPARTGCAFRELARQHGAFAIVAAATQVTLTDGCIVAARISLAGVAPTPVRAAEAEAALVGQEPTPSVLAAAARLAAAATDPSGDVHGSAAYRREMAEVYTRRSLQAAVEQAAGLGGAI